MARKRRDTSVSNSTKKTALSGRRVSRKTVIKNSEIEESIQENRFLDFDIIQKYKITYFPQAKPPLQEKCSQF